MFNQIRAEFYKLFHTKALYLTFALILAVFGIFSIGGQQQFVASSSSLDKTWKIGETVGFLARAYMYYWMNTCSYNMINNLEINILIYFVGTVIITFLVSALILRKQEIR